MARATSIERRMDLEKRSAMSQLKGERKKSSSRGFVITIAIIVLLALGYSLFRTITTPAPQGNQSAQPTK